MTPEERDTQRQKFAAKNAGRKATRQRIKDDPQLAYPLDARRRLGGAFGKMKPVHYNFVALGTSAAPRAPKIGDTRPGSKPARSEGRRRRGGRKVAS